MVVKYLHDPPHTKEHFYNLSHLVNYLMSYEFDVLVLSSQATWCLINPSTSDGALKNNLRFACIYILILVLSNMGVPCFKSNNLISDASMARNLYYQERGSNEWNNNFNYLGLNTITDPSKFAILIPTAEELTECLVSFFYH